ncbi:MAG: phosphoglycerate mutase [Chloroflexota bacterium]|nr:MAG: phosphoglycerate mutase [Chloroflexota bacterium]
MNLTLYLLRHGETAFSRDNAFSGSELDIELTPAGLVMAEAFAAAYRSLPWQAVYVSPMRRAVATAQSLCTALNLEMELRDGLKEMSFGQWEGHLPETIARDYPQDYLRWAADPAWFPPTGGETARAVARRAMPVVEEIVERFVGGNILLVSHKTTIRIILCSLLGLDLSRYRHRLDCPVASLSVVEMKTQGPFLRVLADRSHLK